MLRDEAFGLAGCLFSPSALLAQVCDFSTPVVLIKIVQIKVDWLFPSCFLTPISVFFLLFLNCINCSWVNDFIAICPLCRLPVMSLHQMLALPSSPSMANMRAAPRTWRNSWRVPQAGNTFLLIVVFPKVVFCSFLTILLAGIVLENTVKLEIASVQSLLLLRACSVWGWHYEWLRGC